MSGARVLVASPRDCPETALKHAASFAGRGGEVVLASVVVVPLGQPLDATLARAIDDACAVLDAGERAAGAAGSFDTRLVRGRAFAEAVLRLAGEEDFDVIVLEDGIVSRRNDGRAQIETIIARAPATVVLVRPATNPVPRS